MAGDGVGGGVGSGVPPAASFWAAIERKRDGGGLITPVGVGGFVGEQVVKSLQGAEQFGAGIEVGWGSFVGLVKVVTVGLGESKCFPLAIFDRIVESLSCYFERQYCLHNIDSTTGIGALKSEFFVLNVVVVGDQVNIEILSIFSVRRIIDEGVIVQVFDSAISGFLGQPLEQLCC